jgi:hypothetical protein
VGLAVGSRTGEDEASCGGVGVDEGANGVEARIRSYV